ncbi:MAG TPA: hypothetical protein VJ828_10770 [Lacipirellulaceae bacterium]|nr:hypothetical protein [Lacipirellulaceae bacterium]
MTAASAIKRQLNRQKALFTPVFYEYACRRQPSSLLVFDALRVFDFPRRDTFCDELSCQVTKRDSCMFGLGIVELLVILAMLAIALVIVAGTLQRGK